MVGHSWNEKADPRHVEIITETLGLRRAESTKTQSSVGIKRIMDEINSATDLSEACEKAEDANMLDQAERKKCGSLAWTLNCMSLDRSDMHYAENEIYSKKADPTQRSGKRLKKAARCQIYGAWKRDEMKFEVRGFGLVERARKEVDEWTHVPISVKTLYGSNPGAHRTRVQVLLLYS